MHGHTHTCTHTDTDMNTYMRTERESERAAYLMGIRSKQMSWTDRGKVSKKQLGYLESGLLRNRSYSECLRVQQPREVLAVFW